MRSRKSFFNPGIFRKNMKRCWPVWASYMAIWLLGFGGVARTLTEVSVSVLTEGVLLSAQMVGAVTGAAYGLISAMCVFSYLHNARAANFFHALPVTRDSLFVTNLLSGLAFVLGPVLLFFAGGTVWCAVFTKATFGESLYILWLWLLSMAGQYLFYFGVATLCAMLTGHILMVPVLFAAVNFAVPVGETLVRGLCELMLWGFEDGGAMLTRFCPLWHTLSGALSTYLGKPDPMEVRLSPYYLALALVGLGCIVLSWLFYRKRQLELAGDVIAVRWLRPVFKYGMGLYGALPLGSFIYFLLFSQFSQTNGSAIQSLSIAFSLVLGGAVAYFAAVMLLEKSVRVFKKKHLAGCGALALVLCLLVGATHMDVLGMTDYIPDGEDVESVMVYGMEQRINTESPDGIQAVRELHQEILRHPEFRAIDGYYAQTLGLRVAMVDGRPTAVPEDAVKEEYRKPGAEAVEVIGRPNPDGTYGPVPEFTHEDVDFGFLELEEMRSRRVEIHYLMKNGHRVIRKYMVQLDGSPENAGLEAAMERVWESQIREYLTRGSLNHVGGEFVMNSLWQLEDLENPEDRAKLHTALRKDLAQNNLAGAIPTLWDEDFVRDYTGWTLYMGFDLPTGDGEHYYYDDLSLPVSRKMTNLLAALEELGIVTGQQYLVVPAEILN